ncbi:MAG: hypothetical protein HPY74_05985 [Firmicutes bacterium]|nr:hypothetical protein [Bacillota bacterium]
MTPTTELRTRLRKLLNEIIPAGGSEADTNFLDSEIDDLLKENSNIYEAASAGWTMKAGMLQEKTESYSMGQEKYDLTSLKDQLAHALAMAEQYAGMAKGTSSGLILKISKPEVL